MEHGAWFCVFLAGALIVTRRHLQRVLKSLLRDGFSLSERRSHAAAGAVFWVGLGLVVSIGLLLAVVPIR